MVANRRPGFLAVPGLGSAANVKLSTAKPGDSRANFGSGVPKPSFKLKIEMAVGNWGEARGKIQCVGPQIGGRDAHH